MKYLFWLVVLGVVWWVWSKRSNAPGKADSPERHDPPPEKMVTCAHCGVHLPESEGLADGGRIYCCEAHRAAAQNVER